MSRIEKALEKALEMKQSIKEADAEVSAPQHRDVFKGFELGETLINTDVVDKHIICLKDPHSLVAEQYKKLRARILKTTSADFLNTIMVTSPDVGEGKTITAINLAIALANEIDYTVLLVDADLKNPSIHKYLGVEPKCGLSDYLVGKAKLPDILVKTGIGKLVLLPAGNSLENTAEALSSERMRRLVQEIKRKYNDRYVIFDSAPILVAADSIPLSSYMDGIIFVVQAARTSPKAAKQALSLLKDCRILGAVFNNVPRYLTTNIYPYYYHYGNRGYYKESEHKESQPQP